MRVAVVGHVEWVQFARVSRVPAPGEIVHASDAWEAAAGGGGVAAVVLARLAGSADFLTALGDDPLGHRAADELARHDVAVHAAWRPEPQRRAFTFIDDDHERTITVIGDRLVPHAEESLPWAALERADAVYFTGGDPGALRAARAARVLVATPRARESLAAAGVVLDALVLSGSDATEAYRPGEFDPQPRLVVTTRGARGGRYVDGRGRQRRLGRGAAARTAGGRLRRRRLVRGGADLRARPPARDRRRTRRGGAQRGRGPREPRPLLTA